MYCGWVAYGFWIGFFRWVVSVFLVGCGFPTVVSWGFLTGRVSVEVFGALYTGWLSLIVVSTHSTGLRSGRVRGF